MYLIPSLIGEHGTFGPVIIIKRVLGGDDGIGLDELLISCDEIISREQLGSPPGRFGALEVDIIIVLINNLELRGSYVQLH